MTERTHLVVGAGRMGGALLSGWTRGRRPKVSHSALAIMDPYPSPDAQQAIEAGALHVAAPKPALKRAFKHISVVLLAVKPQMFEEVGVNISEIIPKDALIISILAGTNMAGLRRIFKTQPLIRAMPNTPASIGAGMTAFTCGPEITKEHRQEARNLLKAGGKVCEVETEHVIDIVTAVSGSGPAYFFHMVEALEAAAVQSGLPEEIAGDFARQTFIGAGALLKKSQFTAGDLRRAVTSPGGTTQAALDVLMSDKGLPPIMRETVAAALRRAKELGQES